MQLLSKKILGWFLATALMPCLASIPAQAQTSATLKKDFANSQSRANSLVKGPDDHLYFTGTAEGTATVAAAPILLVKTNVDGDTIWTRRLNEFSMLEVGSRIIMNGPDRLLIAGLAYSGPQQMGVLYQVDTSGALVWVRSFGFPGKRSEFTDLKRTNDGIILCGNIIETATWNSNGWLVKTDSLGHFQWQQTYGGEAKDELSQLELTPDGGYLLAGSTGENRDVELQEDGWLLKTNALGAVIWTKILGVPDTVHYFHSLTPVSDAATPGYLICTARQNPATPHLNTEKYITRMDTAGNFLWKTLLPDPIQLHNPYIIRQLTPEIFGVVAGGFLHDEDLRLQAYAINSNGLILNSHIYELPGFGTLAAADIQAGPDSSICVVGKFAESAHERFAFYSRLLGLLAQPAGITPTHPAFQIGLFPNPAKHSFRLSSDTPLQRVRLQNLQGQTLLKWQAAGAKDLQLHTGGLPSGYYLIYATPVAGPPVTTRLLIQ